MKDQKELNEGVILKPMTLKGHTDTVWSVALGSDNDTVLSGSLDKTVRVWSLSSGLCKRELKGHTLGVFSVALGSDNDTVLSGSLDNTIRVWSLSSGLCKRELKGHTGQVYSVALGSDNDTVLSGSGDKTVRVWSLSSGLCKRELKGHTGWVNSVALGSDNDTVLSGSVDKTVRVWSLSSGLCKGELKGHTNSVFSVALGSDNETVLSGSWDSTVRVWSLSSGLCKGELKGHTGRVWSVALGCDNDTVLSGSGDKTVRVWSLSTGACLKILNFSDAVYTVNQLTKNNQIYAVAGCDDKNIYFQHARTLEKAIFQKPAMPSLAKPTIPAPTIALPATAAAVLVPASSTAAQNQKTKQEEEIEKLRAQVAQLQMAQQNASAATAAATAAAALAKPLSPTGLNLTVSYLIDYTALTLGKKIGQGTFGAVYQGNWRYSDVAVKQLLTDIFSSDVSKEFETEVQVMAKLRSPNIVGFYGYCLSPKYSIVMEYMPNGSLFNMLRNNQNIEWNLRLSIATDMACGLAFLHQEKILHRDIKSLNVLLDGQYKAKLTDFGLSKIKNETRTSTAGKESVGTLAWMAPELFEDEPYTQKSDIYSLGVTFWELAARKIPFSHTANPALIPVLVGKGKRETIPADCPKKLATLIQACWEGDPNKRPNSDSVAQFLQSKQDDFVAFLPGFLSSKQAASVTSFNGAVAGNLNSSAAAAVSSSAGSFNQAVAGNFASGAAKK